MYPTDEELDTIENWDVLKDGFVELMEYIKKRWRFSGGGGAWDQAGNVYHISTIGWSGNESIIHAMKSNFTFWGTCWESSRRGGHYEFVVPEGFAKDRGGEL